MKFPWNIPASVLIYRVSFSSLLAVFLASTSCVSRTMNERGNAQSASGVLSSDKYPQAPDSFLQLCGSKMTPAQYQELLRISDISTFVDFKDAAPRAQRVAEIFAEAKDRRGIFASMYVEITHESVGSTVRGEYGDNEKAAQLVKRFAERYFEPLHNYLRNGAAGNAGSAKFPVVNEWREYYKLAENCKTSDLRLLGTGVNNHMTMDLPYSLQEIAAPESFKDDFMKFGNILILKKRESTNLLIEQQNVYAAGFFDLFFFGRIVDSFAPVGTAATWGFQLIRAEAWRNGSALQEKRKERTTQEGISAAWSARQTVLLVMPHSNSKMTGTEEDE